LTGGNIPQIITQNQSIAIWERFDTQRFQPCSANFQFLPYAAYADELVQLLSSLIIGTFEEGNVQYGIVTFKENGTYAEKTFSTRDKETLLLTPEGL